MCATAGSWLLIWRLLCGKRAVCMSGAFTLFLSRRATWRSLEIVSCTFDLLQLSSWIERDVSAQPIHLSPPLKQWQKIRHFRRHECDKVESFVKNRSPWRYIESNICPDPFLDSHYDNVIGRFSNRLRRGRSELSFTFEISNETHLTFFRR